MDDQATKTLTIRIFGRSIKSFSFGQLGEKTSFKEVKVPKNEVAESFKDKIPRMNSQSSLFTKLTLRTVEFGISNEKADAGQSYVPYFDGSSVTLDVKGPLKGLGFVHYTNNQNYSGYIKPFVKTLDYKDFVHNLLDTDPSLVFSKDFSISPTNCGFSKSASIFVLLTSFVSLRYVHAQ